MNLAQRKPESKLENYHDFGESKMKTIYFFNYFYYIITSFRFHFNVTRNQSL